MVLYAFSSTEFLMSLTAVHHSHHARYEEMLDAMIEALDNAWEEQ
jgi:hypothetical protein